jgi:hypothetical protein
MKEVGVKNSDIRRKIFKLAKSREFILFIIAILGISGSLEAFMGHFPLSYMENKAVSYLDNSNEKAISTFVFLKTMNSIISVLESSDIGLFGENFHPFDYLQPIEDLVKQLSDVILLSIISISTQRLFIQVSRAISLTIVLPLGCILCVAGLWFHKMTAYARRSLNFGRFMIFIAIFSRFVIPVSGWAGDLLTEHFLAKNRDESLAVLGAIAKSAENNDQEESKILGTNGGNAPNSSTSESIKPSSNSLDKTKEANTSFYSDIAQKAKNFYNLTISVAPKLTNSANYLIALFQIFLLQTVIFPIILLFTFYILLKKITNQNFQLTTDSITSLPELTAFLKPKRQEPIKTQEE